jgi:hypothetical protein
LNEALTMVIAPRGLRFCYSSTILSAELLLANDVCENMHGRTVEGLGMMQTRRTYRLEWWLSKFNWAIIRPRPVHSARFLAGNVFMRSEY